MCSLRKRAGEVLTGLLVGVLIALAPRAAPQTPPSSAPAADDLKPHWMPIARWYGHIEERNRHYATREPGGFGVALSSPNDIQNTRASVVLREEVSNFGESRTVVESIAWNSVVNDLYYQNRDGSRVPAGSGGGGSGTITKDDLPGEPSKVTPEARESAQQSLDQARHNFDDAQKRLTEAQQKAAQAKADPAASAGAPLQDYTAVMERYYASPTTDERDVMRERDKLQQQLGEARTKLADWTTQRSNQLMADYKKTYEPIVKQLQDPNIAADKRDQLLKQLNDDAEQLKQKIGSIQSVREAMDAREQVFETAQELDMSRQQVLRAQDMLDHLGESDPRATASAGYGKDPETGAGSVGLQFSVRDAELLKFDIDVIPLKMVGLKTVLNEDYKPTRTSASGIAFNGSAPAPDGSGSATVTYSGQDKKGEPGLIGGGEWSANASFRRVAVEQQLKVAGKVLHRIGVPKDENDQNVITPDQQGPTAAGQPSPGGDSLQGAIPVAGSVTVEAWVIDPAKPPPPSTQPAPADVVAATSSDGSFQLSVPKAADKTLKLRFTYYNKDARLWEFQTLSVNTNDVLTAGVGAGSSTAAPLAGILRQRACYYRYGGVPMEYDLGAEQRGATVRRDGQTITLRFEGLNSILINTFCLKTPYLNQNNQAFSVTATVPAQRLLAARPSFIREDDLREHLGVGETGEAPAQTSTDVKVRGSVVCFPTCVTMVLGGLGLVSLPDNGQHSDEVGKLAQGVYDYYAKQTRQSPPRQPQPPWIFPFPTDPGAAGRMMADAQRDWASTDPVKKAQSAAEMERAQAPYNHWPFVAADQSDLNKQWLISLGADTQMQWMPSSTGSEVLPVQVQSDDSYRPWQAAEIVQGYVKDKYGAGKIKTKFVSTDVFSASAGRALVNALGRGAVSVVSIVHKSSTGAAGGHILVVLGAIVDDTGRPLRVIVHDPYGDQTQHPGLEGYYNPGNMQDKSQYDKDQPGGGGGTKGRYAPYGPEINSYGGSLRSKYWVLFERPDQANNPESLRQRLLPSERWNGGDPK